MAIDPITQVSVPEGWIDFGIGQPDVNFLPLKQMAAAATHLFEQENRSILQYGIQQGNGNFRVSLAQFLSKQYDAAVDPDQLFITAGISQALDFICSLHTQPGDTVIVEEPSYFLALRIFSDYKLNIIGTPIDQNGLIIEALEEKVEQYKPIFVYTVPTFHNPSGVTLSAPRREELTRLSQKYGFYIVADEVYQLLAFDTKPPKPLTYYDTAERVLSLGSFSKILAPGLRLGWMQAKPSLLEPFIACGLLDSGGGLEPFCFQSGKQFTSAGVATTIYRFFEKNLPRPYGHLKPNPAQALTRSKFYGSTWRLLYLGPFFGWSRYGKSA